MKSSHDTGFRHRLPKDLQAALAANKQVTIIWDSLTPLQRNEWICWVTIPKQQTTRAQHITRLLEQLTNGKRTPCCWPGCPHRRPDKAKWFQRKPNT